MAEQVSISPDGEQFPIPGKDEYAAEFERLKDLADRNRAMGREIVVVMGVGFVGAVMAAVVADSTDADGKSGKFVIGMQRPSTRSFWKIRLLNRGVSPVKAEDPEVDPLIRRCVLEKKTLIATYNYDALKLADVVVVDVQCDYLKESLGELHHGPGRHGCAGEVHKDHCQAGARRGAGADRNHGRARHHGIRRLPDHKEGL